LGVMSLICLHHQPAQPRGPLALLRELDRVAAHWDTMMLYP
jgi:hypothetical protein